MHVYYIYHYFYNLINKVYKRWLTHCHESELEKLNEENNCVNVFVILFKCIQFIRIFVSFMS